MLREKGKIVNWNDEKGYGFILPNNSQKNIFVHIKSFTDRNVRPEKNQVVTYTIQDNGNGKKSAINVSRASDNPLRSKTNINKKRFKKETLEDTPSNHLSIVVIISLLLALFAFYKYIFYIPELEPSNYNSSIPYEEVKPSDTSSPIHNEIQNNTYTKYTNNSPETAFENHFSRVQVSGTGSVYRILRDDNEGKRHQKFILRLPSGQTLLVAHNIDLSQRLNGLKVGDNIEFNGQYEWNPKGGVLHWTHHDPRGRHKAGWLKYNNHTYQ